MSVCHDEVESNKIEESEVSKEFDGITGFSENGVETFHGIREYLGSRGFKFNPQNMIDHENLKTLRWANPFTWFERQHQIWLKKYEETGEQLWLILFSLSGLCGIYSLIKKPEMIAGICFVNTSLHFQWYVLLGAFLTRTSYLLLKLMCVLSLILGIVYDQFLYGAMYSLGFGVIAYSMNYLNLLKFMGPEYIHTCKDGEKTHYAGLPILRGADTPVLAKYVRKLIRKYGIDVAGKKLVFVRGGKDKIVHHCAMDKLAIDLRMTVVDIPDGPHNVLIGMSQEQLAKVFKPFLS